MINILIIDNHSVFTKQIHNHFPKNCSFEQIYLEDISNINYIDYDAIILSGGSRYVLIDSPKKYEKEIEIIKKFNKPILGICMGFEVLCYAFDETIKYLGFAEIAVMKIKIEEEDIIVNNLEDSFYAYEAHRFIVKTSKYLKVIANSNHGIEIIKHKTLPLYGTQFHPEVEFRGELKNPIIENFVEIVKNYKALNN